MTGIPKPLDGAGDRASLVPQLAINSWITNATPSAVIVMLGQKVFDDQPPAWHFSMTMSHADWRSLNDLVERHIFDQENATGGKRS